MCALLAVYLTTLLLEGVLRYVLAAAGVPNLLYLRDSIPVGSVLFLFLRSLLRDRRIDLVIAIPSALLACHAVYSAMVGVAIFAIAFGLKIYLFVIYGMAMWPLLRRRLAPMLAMGTAMFAITAAGVFANFLWGTMPWEGLEYETAFGMSSTTRTWWMAHGIARLPGFTRTSFNAAVILGITGLLTMLRYGHPLARLAIFATATTAIVLTTSKGMVLAFPLAALWLVVQDRRPAMDGHVLVGALCAATVVLPLVVVFWDIGSAMKASDFPVLIVSVWERFTSMWPLAFQLLPDGPQSWLGAGLGSIGTPLAFGNTPHQANSADNVAIYMMVSFGVAGLVYCAFPALSVRKVAACEPVALHRMYVAVLVIAYVYGVSTNMIEESFFSFFFGLCFGAAASAWLGEKERTP
ncbi:hypothetical protein UC35_17985 [Ramlibacter tataouinensis]|uniref:Uncharacterized protein n=1 Tax=Ramlibacter tataouinensis TaxID=94132 RepID=A0A127JWY2_9BURK|nr:hypothetical protein UC35_17985 [Ramlibacter tataouinensis]